VTELKLSQSRRAEERGDLAEAIERAKEARTVQPWSSRPYLALAGLERERGDRSAALDHIAEAEARDSEDWHLVSVEAVLLSESGDRRAGEEAFERARALNPRARYLGGSG
jgi:Flp pilus assembly protein TadD